MKTYTEIASNLQQEIIQKIYSRLPFRKSINYHDCYVRVLSDDNSTVWVNWGPHDCKFEELPITAMATIADSILSEITYDIVFSDNNSSNSKGFEMTLVEAIEYIKYYNGTNHSYFADYKGGTVSIVCNETGETVFDTQVL
jgi:hypothetical protein